MTDDWPTWLVRWSWRRWVFGVTFGPELLELSLGPLSVTFNPDADKYKRSRLA